MKEKIKKMPGRIRNYFCSHMSAQVTVTVVLLLILAGLVLQIYVKNQYFNYLLRNTRSMEESMIETSTINIDANLKDIISAACNVGVNETLRVLVENTEADGILLAKEKLTLGSRMDDIAHQIGSVVSIAIVSDEGLWQEYGVYWYQTSSKGVWEDGNLDKLQEIYEKTMALQKEKANVRYYVETDPAVHSQWPQIRMVHIAVPLIGKTYSYSHVKNVAVVSFDMGDILEKSAFDRVADKPLSIGYIADENNRIIYHPNEEYDGMTVESYRKTLDSTENISRSLKYFGWTAYITTDLGKMRAQVNQMYTRSIYVYLFLLCICGFLWQFTIRRVLKPIDIIRDSMRNIKLSKNLPKIEVKGTNEIWQLAGYYNEMAETLERQYKEIRRYYREKNLSIRQKNKAEKEALESQINAHFLCNTLTAINYNAIDNEDYEVADLLKKLSNMLSYTFSRKLVSVSLGQELRWVEQYLYLQKFRLMDVFDYEIEFQEEYGEWPCCKLFIQPFVENSKGVKVFWLDEAEPEYTVYDFENYRYHLGPDIQVGNIYPVMYAKTFFDGMKAEGQENIINLLRCAWAGSQKYGALVWSGDIKSSFPSMKNQVAAGLNMGIAGIPWWTTDIGGFFGANINDPEFHELLIRWFEYGCFCPVMRLHGYRWPLQPQYGTTGGATCVSGAPNEVWSYTDQVCEILSDYLRLRERMLPYITELMEEAHEKGTPVMRPLFYDFPEDKESWNVETEYMFGPKVLVKPITDADARETDVYLPGGASWTNAWTGETFEGGQKVHVAAPIEQIPLFTRDGYKLPMK